MTLASSNSTRGISAHLFRQADAVHNLEFEMGSVLLQRCQAIRSQSKAVNSLQMCAASIKWWTQTNKTSAVHASMHRGSCKPDTIAVVLVTCHLSCPILDSGEGFYSWMRPRIFFGLLIGQQVFVVVVTSRTFFGRN